MITAVRYSGAHREGVLALLEDVPYKKILWDWQFEDPAACLGFDPVVVVDGERVVGFNGVMPAPMKYGSRTVDGLWSCDFYVAEDYRGQGVGRVVKEVLHSKAPLIVTFGVSPRAAAVLKHLGWRQSPEVFTYKLNRRVASVRDLALMGLQAVNWLKGRGRSPYVGRLNWSESLPPAEEVDGLWRRVSEGYQKIVRRDFAYLDWKYQRHPMANYRFLTALDGRNELEALLIVRFQNGLLRIVDWLGPAEDSDLKKAMIEACRREYPGARQLSVTTSDRHFGRALRDAGFFRARTQPSFFVYSAVPGDEGCELGWFLMTGDSDGELLSAARENFTSGGAGG